MHPTAWRQKEVAEVRCRSLLLHACNPCKYCGKSAAQPRRHLTRCSVLFQASLAGLHVDTETEASHDGHGGGDSTGAHCTPADGGGLGGDDGGRSRTTVRDPGRPAQPVTSPWRSTAGTRTRAKANHRLPGQAGQNKNQGKVHWQKTQERTASEQPTGMDAPTQELVKCMAKLVIKREQELMRLRPDLGFVIFADTSDLGCLKMLRSVAESWQEKYEQGTVKHSPQNGPRHVAPEALQGEDGGGAGQRPAAPEVPGGRLAGANGECTEPELGISYLGLGEKVPDCGPGPSTEARGVPPQDRHAHREPAEGGSLDQVLNAEGAAGELRDGGDPFQLDVEFAGNLERSVLPSTPGPERMCGDEDGRAQNATRAHQQAPSCEGGRGRVYGNAAVRLEKSQLARQSVEARVGSNEHASARRAAHTCEQHIWTTFAWPHPSEIAANARHIELCGSPPCRVNSSDCESIFEFEKSVHSPACYTA